MTHLTIAATRVLRTLVVMALLCGLTAAQTTVLTLTGGADNDASGSSVSGGVYGNADAIPDVAVGSPGHDGGLGASQGRAQVFDGVTGTQIFSAIGTAAGDAFGSSVDLGGDVDGDGVNDVIVGAPLRDAGLGVEQGEVIVYSGATGLALHTIAGATAGDRFGSGVAIVGDLDTDGKAEFAVGASRFDGTAGADSGRLTIHSGDTGLAMFTVEGSTAGEFYGAAVAGVGDTDGDSKNDAGVGSPSFDGTAGADCGRIAIVGGATGAEIRVVEGSQAGGEFGTGVGAAGDVDNDTRADVGGGAPLFDGTAGMDSGRVRVISGRDGSILMTVEGTLASAQLGAAIDGGGDVNLDGFDDVIAGAPGFDGTAGSATGRAVVLSGADGTVLFSLEGAAANDGEGTGVAGVGDVRNNNRMEVATGAPGRDGAGTDRGEVTVLGGTANGTQTVEAYAADSQPRMSALCDADGDGDLDLVVVGAGSVSIHWNGDQTGSVATAAFSSVTRTDVTLSPGASGVSVAAGNLDVDVACEIVVGRSDGTVDIIDGTGSGVTTAFALTLSSPFTVDTSAGPGAIADVAILGTGGTGSIICAGAGTFTVAGFIDQITDPMGSPALAGQLVSGGSFSSVVVGDIDGDTNDDIIAANSSTSASGGVHVLDGSSAFAPATGSPFAAGVTPNDLTLCDLDGDTTTDDVAVASLNFTAGGVRILPDYVAGAGFGTTVNPGLTLARSVAAGNFDVVIGDDLAVLDGIGNLIRLEGWDGSAFVTQTATSTTEGAGVDVVSGQLTQGALGLCDTDEVVTSHLSTDLVNVWRLRRVFAMTAVANTGCPFAAPTALISLSGEVVIGASNFTIDLSGASVLSMAFLVATANSPLGSTPSVDTTSGCGVASSSGALAQFFTFTDVLGAATIPAGIPNDPCLVGVEFLLQWGILDGGPLLSVLTVSDAVVVTIGEN